MSKSVDVLAVIDSAIEGIHGEGYACPELEDAHDAIAELIEAATPAAANDDYGMDADEIQRLIAALTRVKGIGQ